MKADGYVSYADKALAVSGPSWNEYLNVVSGFLDEMPDKNRAIAGLLWSIERYGDLDHVDDPAPLHMDMADRIISVPGAIEALITALQS